MKVRDRGGNEVRACYEGDLGDYLQVADIFIKLPETVSLEGIKLIADLCSMEEVYSHSIYDEDSFCEGRPDEPGEYLVLRGVTEEYCNRIRARMEAQEELELTEVRPLYLDRSPEKAEWKCPVCDICKLPNEDSMDFGEVILPDGRHCHYACALEAMGKKMFYMEYTPTFFQGFDKHIKVVDSWEDFAEKEPPKEGWHYITAPDSNTVFVERDEIGEDGTHDVWGIWRVFNAPRPFPYDDAYLNKKLRKEKWDAEEAERSKMCLAFPRDDVSLYFQVDHDIKQIKIVTPDGKYNTTMEINGDDDLEGMRKWLGMGIIPRELGQLTGDVSVLHKAMEDIEEVWRHKVPRKIGSSWKDLRKAEKDIMKLIGYKEEEEE